MELARRIFDISDARPFQIVAEGLSLWENAAKNPIRRCRAPLLLELFESHYDLRVKREGLQPPVLGVLGLHHDMWIGRIQEDIGPREGVKLLSLQAQNCRGPFRPQLICVEDAEICDEAGVFNASSHRI